MAKEIVKRDHIWWSDDGVRLHAHVYEPTVPSSKTPVICLPGLTRNARDFSMLAPLLAQDRTVYAIDIRGRGDSGYAKDPMSYVPLTYVRDLVALIDGEDIDKFIGIGTSLGGLVLMLLAAMQPQRIAAVTLNDIGPEIEASGLDRIGGYVGQTASHLTWVHAARSIADANAQVYPDWGLEDWLVMAKRTHRLTPEGRIAPDYDSNIAQPFKQTPTGDGPDLWPAFTGLKSIPTLVVRGALSDILASGSAQKMVDALDDARLVTIDQVGHAPTLDEPAAVAAITALIASIG